MNDDTTDSESYSEKVEIGKVSLSESVERLNDTARSLSALLVVVNKNQEVLLDLTSASRRHAEAISHASTKKELIDEVGRLNKQRKTDIVRNRLVVGITFALSLILISASAVTLQEFKSNRRDANVAYQAISKKVCEDRSVSWDAIQVWIKTQIVLLEKDGVTNQALKSDRLTAYKVMLKSFPDVDCNAVGTGLAVVIPDINGQKYLSRNTALFYIR